MGLGDVGTWDSGTLGRGTRGRGHAGARGRRNSGTSGRKDVINKQHLNFALNLQYEFLLRRSSFAFSVIRFF